MGLHGSSTTPLLLQDAKVPADGVLGEIGKGHKVAFNVLNYGRFKLAAMCTGEARPAIGEAAAYALSRRQFGQPIAAFGAIRHKLAEMTVRLYAAESMLYRVTGLIDQAIELSARDEAAVAGVLEEFALEASLIKVAASEMTGFVLDENVQIHGGNGFVRDYPAERRYRDARPNRIFEGTNEINRLLMPGLLVKRARAGAFPLEERLAQVRDATHAAAGEPFAGPVGGAVAAMKIATLSALDLALARYGDGLGREQEVTMLVSDLLIDTFAVESVALRASARTGSPFAALHADAAAVFVHDAALRARAACATLAGALGGGDEVTVVIRRFDAQFEPRAVDTIALRRRIATAVLERRRYPFS
jgi:hypothetical protein